MTKRTTSSQLPLHLPLEANRAREDLIVGKANEQAIRFLDAWPDWPSNVVVLAGPVGAGKSHLAQVWAAGAGASFLSAHPDITDFPEPAAPLVVEDLRQGSFSETWLFHLINAVRAADTQLLLTSRRWPADWGISLPDLRSRIKQATLLELHEPNDDLLRAVLFKQFTDRQMQVDAAVIDYLALRIERSLGAVQKIVEKIDELSLAERRSVTKPLASEALQAMGWKS